MIFVKLPFLKSYNNLELIGVPDTIGFRCEGCKILERNSAVANLPAHDVEEVDLTVIC